MKKLILFALAAFTLTFASCSKEKNGSAGSALTTVSYADLNIKTSGQTVKVSVTSNVLNMFYNEDVTLIIDSAKLGEEWAVHLKEDFTGTQLADFDYHSMTKYGVNATNWVDDNLNNVVIYSSKDTLINNKMFVKKRITRSFVYQKAYNTAADATVMMNQILKQNDILTFNAYLAPVDPTVAAASNTAKLTYVKM